MDPLRGTLVLRVAYRFYARFIAYRVLQVDDTRATPAEKLNNGRDFDVTDRRVLFGHHFAAIAGAGPLVGPVLAAQIGYLPGTICHSGCHLRGRRPGHGGAVLSMRRNGKASARWSARRSGRSAASRH